MPNTSGLNVQELIDELSQVKDKTKIVEMSGCDCDTTVAWVNERGDTVTIMNLEYDYPKGQESRPLTYVEQRRIIEPELKPAPPAPEWLKQSLARENVHGVPNQ